MRVNERWPFKIIFEINETWDYYTKSLGQDVNTKVRTFEHWYYEVKSFETNNIESKFEYFLDKGNVFNTFKVQKD